MMKSLINVNKINLLKNEKSPLRLLTGLIGKSVRALLDQPFKA
jgi:hypothetical protein